MGLEGVWGEEVEVNAIQGVDPFEGFKDRTALGPGHSPVSRLHPGLRMMRPSYGENSWESAFAFERFPITCHSFAQK
jgi:hypothetical protein